MIRHPDDGKIHPFVRYQRKYEEETMKISQSQVDLSASHTASSTESTQESLTLFRGNERLDYSRESEASVVELSASALSFLSRNAEDAHDL